MDKKLNSAAPVVSRETVRAERQRQAMLKRWAIKKAKAAADWQAFKRRADARAERQRGRA